MYTNNNGCGIFVYAIFEEPEIDYRPIAAEMQAEWDKAHEKPPATE